MILPEPQAQVAPTIAPTTVASSPRPAGGPPCRLTASHTSATTGKFCQQLRRTHPQHHAAWTMLPLLAAVGQSGSSTWVSSVVALSSGCLLTDCQCLKQEGFFTEDSKSYALACCCTAYDKGMELSSPAAAAAQPLLTPLPAAVPYTISTLAQHSCTAAAAAHPLLTPLPAAVPYTIRLGTISRTKSAGRAKLTPLPRPCRQQQQQQQKH
jgi:hypothetical protein